MDMRPTSSQSALRDRRIQTAKGELEQFVNAVLSTTDQKVRRTFRGFVASLHGAIFDDEQQR